MQFFSTLYDKVLSWSAHKRAPCILAGVSFAESSFFPVPPDVMLISMGLVRPNRVWFYALLTTLFSVLGGMFGYLIGVFFLHIALPYLTYFGYDHTYLTVKTWFATWGVWAVIVAGFTPIPYKVFTIAAGAMHMLFFPFVLASLIGRGGRFFLVSLIMYLGGERIERQLARHIEWIGWLALFLILMIILFFKLT